MPSFSVLLHIWCCYKTYTIKGLLLCPWCVVTTAANLHPYQTVATYHRLPCKIQWVHFYLWLSKVKAVCRVAFGLISKFWSKGIKFRFMSPLIARYILRLRYQHRNSSNRVAWLQDTSWRSRCSRRWGFLKIFETICLCSMQCFGEVWLKNFKQKFQKLLSNLFPSDLYLMFLGEKIINSWCILKYITFHIIRNTFRENIFTCDHSIGIKSL